MWNGIDSPCGLEGAEQDGEVTAGSSLVPTLEALGEDVAGKSDDIGRRRRVVVGAHLEY